MILNYEGKHNEKAEKISLMRLFIFLVLILNVLQAADILVPEKSKKRVQLTIASEDQNSTTESSNFYDENGQFDVSGYLSQVYGFLPVPILITEPAIGYGGGVALMYLHDKFTGKKSASGRNIPPSVSGIIAGGTENGTYMLGAFHAGYWLEDTLRTVTFIGYPNINVDMYSNNQAIELNMKGPILYQSAKARIAESNFFLGAAYMYAGVDVSLDDPLLDALVGGKVSIAALTAIGEYDSRDNTMSPDDGMMLNLQARFFNEVFGADFNFNALSAQTLFYNTVGSDWHIDLRLQAETVEADKAPAYLYPFVMMRGIPAMRYQGEHTALAEMQFGYAFDSHWRGLVFGGVGKAFGEQILAPTISFSDAPERYSGGVGFRYLIASKFGLRMGIDLAKSENDSAIYIQFGTAWKGL